MITKITMENVASYKQKATLKTKKKVNLIYGLNGSGKTIISNYLHDSKGDEFSQCLIDGFNENQQKILVYNQKFVEQNFYESQFQKGIFTLAKENKEAVEAISKAKKQREKLQEILNDPNSGLEKQLETKEEEINQKYKAIKDKIWEKIIIWDKEINNHFFHKQGFFDGLRDKKDKLYQRVIKIDEFEDTNKTTEQIKNELQQLGKYTTETEKLCLPIDTNTFLNIEQNAIFEESIIGNENSSIAKLISKLGNSDWVKSGINYFPMEGDQTCPFCQQKTLTSDLQEEIKNYFDESYQNQTNELKKLSNQYQENKQKIISYDFERDFFEEQDKETIRRLVSELQNLLGENINKIQNKLGQLSQSFLLDTTENKINEIKHFISEKNDEIEELNKKIKHSNETKEYLKVEFWKVQRKELVSYISDYKKDNKKLADEKKVISDRIAEINKEIKVQNNIVSEQQKNITNIEETIEKINNHLLDFGITNIEIIKHDENQYCIKRDYEQPQFKSLSEGEKTVISFLYFIELCKGEENRGDTREKIIVIDDPISSLSHMYTFNIAHLVRDCFIEPKQNDFIQCFILTHSLYFFHELAKKQHKENQKLFYIKKTGTSQIEEIDYSTIQNEYDVYWNIVRDASQENIALVANAMRNIIEYFFGFIERLDDIKEIFKKDSFKGSNFQSFKRYIQRESHDDRTNINNYKEFDVDVFKKAFEQMFIEARHKDHYDKMMQSTSPKTH